MISDWCDNNGKYCSLKSGLAGEILLCGYSAGIFREGGEGNF